MDNIFLSEVIKGVVKFGVFSVTPNLTWAVSHAEFNVATPDQVVSADSLMINDFMVSVRAELDDGLATTVAFYGPLNDLLARMAQDVKVTF